MPWARVPVTMLSTPPPAPGSPPAAATLISPGGNLQTGGGGGLDTRPLTLAHHTPSPVSGSVELGVNGGDLHAGPLGRRHQVVLVHAVLQAVRDAALEGGGGTGQREKGYWVPHQQDSCFGVRDRVPSPSGEGVSFLPVMARRTSLAASSRASTEACSLYQDVCGVQIRLGASFRGPAEKLTRMEKVLRRGKARGGSRRGGGRRRRADGT